MKCRLDTQFSLEEYKELEEEKEKLGLTWNKCILIWMRYSKEARGNMNKRKVNNNDV
jgi:hypothetical protein